MTEEDERERTIGRRTVLQTAAAGSIVSLGAVTATAQDADFELGGQISGWVGQSPGAIADEQNPTLELTAGEDYTLVWENLDGAPHNFTIEDESGEENFVETEIVSSSGETQTVEFTAQEGMAEYYCQPHPNSMRGEVSLGDGADGGDGQDAEDDQDAEDGQLIGEGPTVGLETVAEGLTAPLDFEVADEEADRRFIVDQTGYVYVHGEDGLQDEPFLDVSDQLVEFMEFDERGLLGLAFHPDFSENGRFFVRYSAPSREGTPEEYDHTFVLSEFRTADDENSTADPDSERTILEIPQPQFNHNSGEIAFGPDGYLYVGTGDGGGGNDVGEGHVEDWYDGNDGGNGQDTTENLLGGILRLDVDAESDDRPYGIPDDNPLVDMDGHRDEYYAWGFRNPWGMSFTDDGQLLVADVGQELFESVNHVQRGGNYSWNVKEGTHCFSTESPNEPPEDCPDSTPDDVRGGEPLLEPVIEYPQTLGVGRYGGDGGGDGGDNGNGDGGGGNGGDGQQQIGTSITGGYLYEGGSVDALDGTYIFGDWSQDGQESPGTVFLARPPDGWPEANVNFEDMFLDPPTDDNETAADTETGAGADDNETETDADNETAADGNETDLDDNETDLDDNETDLDGNETGLDDNESDADNETDTAGDGNETDAAGGDTGGASQEGLWPIERIQLQGEAAENGRPTGFVYAFGEDADGELYVLTTSTSTVEGDGAVHRLVPAEDGGETTDGDGTEADGNESETDETAVGNESETDGGSEVGNESDADGGTDADNESESENDTAEE